MTVTFTADIRDRLESLLTRFSQLARTGPYDYRWCHHHDGGKHPHHIVFGCMVHGNEFGSLPAAVRLVEAIQAGEIQFGGKVTIFIGNPEAARENRRYLEADLNRVFLHTQHTTHEHLRAQSLMPILDAADVFIDFHQTILETTQPFYIFPWQKAAWKWARAIRTTDVWVTRSPHVNFSAGTKCSDEYVFETGRPGVTIELSEKGFSDQAERLCWQTITKALHISEQLANGETIDQLADRQGDLVFLETTFAESFDRPEKSLRPGLVNFQSVQSGDQLNLEGTPEMKAPHDGVILFPKYPERIDGVAQSPWPKEIYRLVSPMQTHPLEKWEASTEL